jgi:hypothetical protein
MKRGMKKKKCNFICTYKKSQILLHFIRFESGARLSQSPPGQRKSLQGPRVVQACFTESTQVWSTHSREYPLNQVMINVLPLFLHVHTIAIFCFFSVQLYFSYKFSPNVVVEWLRLVPGSNLGAESGYPEWGFSWVYSVPRSKCIGSRPLPSTSFQIRHIPIA